MKRTDDFLMMADRYRFDFGECSSANGFAQVDTGQDASYYGTWANPFTFEIITYAEGDICRLQAESKGEFVREIQAIRIWNETQGHGFFGIDAMCQENIESEFRSLGLGDLLH